MDRVKPELLTSTEPYIQHNVTIGEFIARIEPAIGGDAARRLYALLDDYLDAPMPNEAGNSPIPGPGGDDDDDD